MSAYFKNKIKKALEIYNDEEVVAELTGCSYALVAAVSIEITA